MSAAKYFLSSSAEFLDLRTHVWGIRKYLACIIDLELMLPVIYRAGCAQFIQERFNHASGIIRRCIFVFLDIYPLERLHVNRLLLSYYGSV
jgi:hypothetical protein